MKSCSRKTSKIKKILQATTQQLLQIKQTQSIQIAVYIVFLLL